MAGTTFATPCQNLQKFIYALGCNMSTRRLGWICGMAALGVASCFILTGCVGYVGPDGGDVYVSPPPVVVGVWGGDYDRPHDAHVFSHRGYESRAYAHHWH